MGKKKDLTGLRFGRLTIVGSAKKQTLWLCRCLCGRFRKATTGDLLSGNIDKCGWCTHGKTGTRLYRIWIGFRQRCNNQNNPSYHRYGGRGITVCDEWKNDFSAFRDWALANGYTDNLTIDRKNNDGAYSPENCRWITKSENSKKMWCDRRKR